MAVLYDSRSGTVAGSWIPLACLCSPFRQIAGTNRPGRVPAILSLLNAYVQWTANETSVIDPGLLVLVSLRASAPAQGSILHLRTGWQHHLHTGGVAAEVRGGEGKEGEREVANVHPDSTWDTKCSPTTRRRYLHSLAGLAG